MQGGARVRALLYKEKSITFLTKENNPALFHCLYFQQSEDEYN